MEFIISIALAFIIEQYMQYRLKDMGKLELMYKYKKEGLLSGLLYVESVLISLVIVAYINNIKQAIYSVILLISGGTNKWLDMLDIVFNIAIIFLVSSLLYLYYTVINIKIKYRIKHIDKDYHRVIQVAIKAVLSASLIASFIILMMKTSLKEIYFNNMEVSLIIAAIIVASMFYATSYYQIHDRKYKFKHFDENSNKDNNK